MLIFFSLKMAGCVMVRTGKYVFPSEFLGLVCSHFVGSSVCACLLTQHTARDGLHILFSIRKFSEINSTDIAAWSSAIQK